VTFILGISNDDFVNDSGFVRTLYSANFEDGESAFLVDLSRLTLNFSANS